MRTGFLFLALLSNMVVKATTFYERPFPSEVQDTNIIVHGKVGASYSDWSKGVDGGKQLYTFYELQVEEVIKGSAKGKSIIIREMGGEKDGVGMNVPGASKFEQGENVVVMLLPQNVDGSYSIRGLMMGKLNVQKDANGNETLSGPALRENAQGEVVHDDESQSGTSRSKWTLNDLRSLVKKQSVMPTNQSPPPGIDSRLRPLDAKAQATQPPISTQATPAPPLQPTDQEKRGNSLWDFKSILLIGLGLGGIILISRWRKK